MGELAGRAEELLLALAKPRPCSTAQRSPKQTMLTPRLLRPPEGSGRGKQDEHSLGQRGTVGREG